MSRIFFEASNVNGPKHKSVLKHRKVPRVIALLFSLVVALVAVESKANVVGNIDGFFMSGSNLVLSGWACVYGSSSPIAVHLYADAPYPTGSFVNYATSNLPSEPGVAAACGTSYGYYRFQIPLTSTNMSTWGYHTIYVHGIDNVSNPTIAASGKYRIPNRVATLVGAVGDGSTDDTAALQSAVDSGGTTYLPFTGKFYKTSAPIKLGSNSEIRIDGMLKMAGDVNPGYTNGVTNQWGVVQVKNNASNVIVSGSGTIDGDSSTKTHCCVGGVVAGSLLGDYGSNISNVTVTGLTIQNTFQWPISLDGTNGATLSYLNISNGGNSVQFAHSTTNAHADHLTITNINDIGFAFYNGVTHSSLSYSKIYNIAGASGVTVISDDGNPMHPPATQYSSYIDIYDNTSTGNKAGFDILNGVTGGSTTEFFSNITWSNNVSHDNTDDGFSVRNCDHCTISGNQDRHNGVSPGCFVAGVYVDPYISNLSITGNSFADENPYLCPNYGRTGRGVSINTHGVTNDTRFSGISITNNTFTDDQSTKTMDSAVCVGGSLASPPTLSGNTKTGISTVPGCIY